MCATVCLLEYTTVEGANLMYALYGGFNLHTGENSTIQFQFLLCWLQGPVSNVGQVLDRVI